MGSYPSVCLSVWSVWVEVPCLRASGEDYPLSVCLSVPLILLIRRKILLELPTSKLYEPPNPFDTPNNLLRASDL
jgi:hypothetical protein